MVPRIWHCNISGNAASRKKIMDLEFHEGQSFLNSQLKPKFHIMITTYFVNVDIDNLKEIELGSCYSWWSSKVENKESKLYKLCNKLENKFQTTIDGTPIQNSIDELINIFKYLIPNDSSLHKEVDELTLKIAPPKQLIQ